MDHISTAGSYQSALLNIMAAQQRQQDAAASVGTGKIGTDLEAYGGNSEKLTATKTLQSRIDGYLNNMNVLNDKLGVQDAALNQVASASQQARDAIANAIATGDATPLLGTLQNALSTAGSALNMQYQGQYLFAGGQVNTPPFAASTLSDLTAAGAIQNVFKNDQTRTASRLDDDTTTTTGFLASDIAQPLAQALQGVEAFNQASDPLTGTLTPAQTAYLQGVLQSFDDATSSVNLVTEQNGIVQKQLSTAQTTLQSRSTALKGVMGDLSDVDMATVASQLNMAQTALAASSSVFTSLKNDSLLNMLSSG